MKRLAAADRVVTCSFVELPGGYVWLPRYDGSQVWDVDPRDAITAGWRCLMLGSVVALPEVGRSSRRPSACRR